MTGSALFVTTVPITLEAFLRPFACHLRAQGWRVDGMANGATHNRHIDEDFDELHDVAWTRNPLSPSNLIGTAARVRQVVEANRYDIVHVHTPIAAFVTRYALRSVRGPRVIYTAHGFHFYEGQSALPHAVYRTMERLAARWTDYLVTINAEDHAAAKSFSAIDTERVRLIEGIGVDTDLYREDRVSDEAAAAVRTGLGIPEDAFMLLMVAEFGAVKRHAHLVDALARVADPNVITVFVGDGPLEADICSRVERLSLGPQIRFAGYRRDVPALLKACDALALVSEREGLPRSVLEAMSASRPVIGTQTRGIVDAVGDGGWIVAKHDAGALASAIADAAAHPQEVARRGALARERVVERFALDKIIEQYEELYREALAAPIRRG